MAARRLPIKKIHGRDYFQDDRLEEYRAVDNLHDRIPFKGRVELEAHSDVEDGCSTANIHWCVVSLTLDLAKLLIRRMDLVRELKEQDKDLFQIRFHGHVGAEWFDNAEEGEGPTGDPVDTEYDTIRVTECDVEWHTYADAVDVPLFSEPILRKDIEEIVNA